MPPKHRHCLRTGHCASVTTQLQPAILCHGTSAESTMRCQYLGFSKMFACHESQKQTSQRGSTPFFGWPFRAEVGTGFPVWKKVAKFLSTPGSMRIPGITGSLPRMLTGVFKTQVYKTAAGKKLCKNVGVILEPKSCLTQILTSKNRSAAPTTVPLGKYSDHIAKEEPMRTWQPVFYFHQAMNWTRSTRQIGPNQSNQSNVSWSNGWKTLKKHIKSDGKSNFQKPLTIWESQKGWEGHTKLQQIAGEWQVQQESLIDTQVVVPSTGLCHVRWAFKLRPVPLFLGRKSINRTFAKATCCTLSPLPMVGSSKRTPISSKESWHASMLWS